MQEICKFVQKGGIFMPLRIPCKLTELMEQFHVLTGLHIALLDGGGQELLAVPAEGLPFCTRMQTNAAFCARCQESRITLLARCRRENGPTVHRCHAGLIAVAVPLAAGNEPIGYMTLGGVTDRQEADAPSDGEICRIPYQSAEQITAAAHVLAACAGYVLLDDRMRPTEGRFFERVEAYVREHIGEELTVGRLCRVFHVSRTSLYAAMRPHLQGGIAAYIRCCRLRAAADLVKGTTLPIKEIATRVGFEDDAYFLRVFKKTYGISPRRLRAENSQTATKKERA